MSKIIYIVVLVLAAAALFFIFSGIKPGREELASNPINSETIVETVSTTTIEEGIPLNAPLSEIQVHACTVADREKTCDRLLKLKIDPEECCKYLNKCC